MNGLLYVIDQLGAEVAALRQQNAELQQALAAHEQDANPDA